MSGKSISPDPRWGYLPLFKPALFEIFDAEQRNLAASAIWDGAGQQWPDVLCLQEVRAMVVEDDGAGMPREQLPKK
jgi:hypothetical protein